MASINISKTIRIIARILGVIVLSFLLFMIVGHIFFPDTDSASFQPEELAAFIFFPFGTILGILVGWKKELVGGIISVVSILGFSILILFPRGTGLESSWIFWLLHLPGFLFLTNGLLERNKY